MEANKEETKTTPKEAMNNGFKQNLEKLGVMNWIEIVHNWEE